MQTIVFHYKEFYKENTPKKIEEAYNVQLLERPVRNNLDFVEQW